MNKIIIVLAIVIFLMFSYIVFLTVKYKKTAGLLYDKESHDKEKLKSDYNELLNAFSHYFYHLGYMSFGDNSHSVLYDSTRAKKNLTKIPMDKRFAVYSEHFVYHEDRAFFINSVKKDMIVNRIKDGEDYNVVFRSTMGAENNFHYLRFIFSPVFKEETLVGAYVLLADIDNTIKENKAKEVKNRKELADALSQAQQANRAKTAFLNNISHDMRTPLNAIIGFVSLCQAHLGSKDLTKEYLDKISQSSEHMLSLINDVLDMTRIENGQINIKESEENIMDILTGLETMIRNEIDEKNQIFIVDTATLKDVNVLCDKMRMTQVMLNILSNAIKYTPEGGRISLRVSERNMSSKGVALFDFCVTDTGVGMSKEFVESVFDPFSRENTQINKEESGAGLGLAITKNLVDMMGGKIRVTSRPEKGTEFVVSIELKLVKNKTGKPQALSHQTMVKQKEHYDFNGKRVLVVEDNSLNMEIAVALLMDEGIEVDTAEDGAEAVKKVSESAPGYYDLVLMDIQMPVMDGYEATTKIRALEDKKLADIPIIAMTANAFEEDRKNAFAAGMNAHIPKPISISVLNSTMKKILEGANDIPVDL